VQYVDMDWRMFIAIYSNRDAVSFVKCAHG
jgi:hypothetical protein